MPKNERKLKKIEETREMVISFICRRRTQLKTEPTYLCSPSKRITRAFLVLSFSIYLVTSFSSLTEKEKEWTKGPDRFSIVVVRKNLIRFARTHFPISPFSSEISRLMSFRWKTFSKLFLKSHETSIIACYSLENLESSR